MAYISRRSFMQGAAGLFVAFSMPRAAAASATTVAADSVDAYLAVAPDGSVMVFSGKVDLGTGARAAIRQIVAEELSLSPERIVSSRATPRSRPIRDRPAAQPESWLAACRSGKRRRPRGRDCWRWPPRNLIVRGAIWTRGKAQS